ncbi:hypothetical protein R3P38DRAFT_3370354 [Favolaschia claudopus]|uniref:Uncharacterized protein n=1 Tax=Favolaschia claudopus TaxID=2862362 RepID=A0AAW0A1X1_9AGAR
MATDSTAGHHTRAATRAGVYPPPRALYSPTLSYGSISGEDIDALVGESVVPTVTSVTRPTAAQSVRAAPSGARISTPSPSGDLSSALPSLSESRVGVLVDVDDNDGRGWTPVTRKTSRTHREDNESVRSESANDDTTPSEKPANTESTVAQATADMSNDELISLARRHEAFAAQLRAKVEHMDLKAPTDEVIEKRDPTHRATVEEVEDEDDLISFKPSAGPSRNKGKGADPGNWGDISSLANFSERELEAQRDALLTWNTIHQMKQEEITPHLEFSEDVSQRPSSPKVKKPRKRSKSPKAKKENSNFAAQPAPKLVELVEPLKNESKVQERANEHARDEIEPRGAKSGRSIDEVYNLLTKTINELDVQKRVKHEKKTERSTSLKSKARSSEERDKNLPKETNPSRITAESFFARALKDTRKQSVKAKPPPSDPSDDSSSSSDESPSESSSSDESATCAPAYSAMCTVEKAPLGTGLSQDGQADSVGDTGDRFRKTVED